MRNHNEIMEKLQQMEDKETLKKNKNEKYEKRIR